MKSKSQSGKEDEKVAIRSIQITKAETSSDLFKTTHVRTSFRPLFKITEIIGTASKSLTNRQICMDLLRWLNL